MVSDSQVATTEARAMRRALELAGQGWGRVHPNPMVGAVVMRDGKVIGEGCHAEFGALHAERAALNAAGNGARGGTLVTTLEPCTHHGKQPPCVDAVIASGVVRVIVAARDPNPEAGGGIERLQAAGVKVVTGVCQAESERLNFRFLRRFRSDSRPFVAVKMAVTMDGYIADRHGRSQWISGPAAREWVHHERAGYAAVGVGGHTALVDDARLTVRGVTVPRISPWRVVFDRSGQLTDDHGIFGDARDVPVVVVHGSGRVPGISPRDGVQLVEADDLVTALAALRGLGMDALLVEGGGRLAGSLLQEDLVDRVYQLQAPAWLGQGIPAWAGLAPRDLSDAIRWHIVDRRELDDDTLLVMEH